MGVCLLATALAGACGGREEKAPPPADEADEAGRKTDWRAVVERLRRPHRRPVTLPEVKAAMEAAKKQAGEEGRIDLQIAELHIDRGASNAPRKIDADGLEILRRLEAAGKEKSPDGEKLRALKRDYDALKVRASDGQTELLMALACIYDVMGRSEGVAYLQGPRAAHQKGHAVGRVPLWAPFARACRNLQEWKHLAKRSQGDTPLRPILQRSAEHLETSLKRVADAERVERQWPLLWEYFSLNSVLLDRIRCAGAMAERLGVRPPTPGAAQEQGEGVGARLREGIRQRWGRYAAESEGILGDMFRQAEQAAQGPIPVGRALRAAPMKFEPLVERSGAARNAVEALIDQYASGAGD
ncbi:MAG: hypothetical protein ACODAJ_07510 [Planctomycetota bacterium]